MQQKLYFTIQLEKSSFHHGYELNQNNQLPFCLPTIILNSIDSPAIAGTINRYYLGRCIDYPIPEAFQ
jgi:hypothetical protein